MAWQSHPSVIPLLLGSSVLWVDAGYLIWQQRAGRRAPGQLLAAGLIACFAVSVAAFALEQAHTGLGPKVFYNQVQYVGDAPLAAFLLGYVLVYTGYDLSTRSYLGLFALPAVVLGSVFTNGLHHLYWSDVSLGTVAGYVVLDNGAGPLFWVYILYTYVFIAGAVLVLVRAAVDSAGSHRRHTLALVAGTALPVVAGIAYVLELGPTPTPNYPGYAYLLTAGVITYTVHRDDMFAVVPVARRTTLGQLDDGVLTVDAEGIVADANDAARRYLGVGQEDSLVGRPASAVLGHLDIDREDGVTADASVRSTVETDEGVFDVTSRALTRSETAIGEVVVLRDVTDRHRRERRLRQRNEQLELLHELVRHDIRNEATLTLEHLRRIGGSVESDAQAHLDAVEQSGERIVELTERARELAGAVSAERDLTPVALDGVLRRELAKASTLSNEATVEAVTDIPGVDVMADDMLASVFRNLLTNAIEHNDSAEPTVTVAVERDAETVTVDIADDGPGIPDEHKDEVFLEGRTLAGSDGTGYGLYLVATVVEQYGGAVSVTDNRPTGSVFSVTLPVVDAGDVERGQAEETVEVGR